MHYPAISNTPLWLVCLFLLMLAVSAPVSAADEWLNLTDGQGERIQDPVFQQMAYVYEAGRKHQETILLVHGLGHGAAQDWKHLIPKLAKKYHVVTFDLPGFGRSDKGNHLYSPGTYAQFINFIAKKYTNKPFVLIGHSMGAAIATVYAAAFPKDVKKLVLVDAAGILHQVAFEKSLANNAARKVTPAYDLYASEIRQLISKIIDLSEYIDVGPELVLKLAPLRNTILGGDPVKIAGFALVREDFSRHVPRIKAQTLIVWGKEDPVAPLRTGKMLHHLIRDTALITLDNTGHNPMLEKPDEFNQLILDYLAADPGVMAKFDKPDQSSTDTPAKDKLVCRGERNRLYEGVYKEVEIIDCNSVTLLNVKTNKLVIHNSTVNLENCKISGSEYGIFASDSDVRITNGRIEGDIAIRARESRFDIAGTHVIGRDKLVTTKLPSNFVFSIVSAETPLERHFLHDFKVVSSLAPL